MSLELARTVADAVLYEGYLLYPYRSTSSKNQSRWQWGVLGPPGAAAASLGEESSMSTQCVLRSGPVGQVSVHLRFLQLQTRSVERATDDAECFEPVAELTLGARTWLTWDEAVEHEIELGPCPLGALAENDQALPVDVAGGEGVELLRDDDGTIVGRVIRRRWPLKAVVSLGASPVDGLVRLSLCVENVAAETPTDKKQAIRSSLIGAHLLVRAQDADFVSLLEPSDDAVEAVAGCTSRRCWPVLAGEPGQTDVVLASPIILYDYPEIAAQSPGALFDATEIDEILTLRTMVLTDAEKREARATDDRAAAIIDRVDAMPPELLDRLHGTIRYLREATGGTIAVPPLPKPEPERVPWWDPGVDASVSPDTDGVLVGGVAVARGSRVRLRPGARRADAQDMFLVGREARVEAVLFDIDDVAYLAVTLADDPNADLFGAHGRFLYFAPDEVEPLGEEG